MVNIENMKVEQLEALLYEEELTKEQENLCKSKINELLGSEKYITEELIEKYTDDDYKTSIGVAKLVSFIGWVAVLAGVGLSAWLVKDGGMSLLGLPSAITVILVGLLLVIGGQASRAVMDNANYSKQMLNEMCKKS